MKAKMEKEAELAIKVEREKAKIYIESKETEQEIVLNCGPFDLAKNIKFVPAFTEYDPEDYFCLFEGTAKHFDWSAEQWVWLIKPKLSGKVAKVIKHLEDINDYNKVKKAILLFCQCPVKLVTFVVFTILWELLFFPGCSFFSPLTVCYVWLNSLGAGSLT